LKTGVGDSRLIELCELLGGTMLMLGEVCRDIESGKREFKKILQSGQGYDRFKRIAEAQGADPNVWSELELGVAATHSQEILAPADGFIKDIQPREIGLGLVDLGAGRKIANDPVDPTAGITFLKQRGMKVAKHEIMASVQWSRDSEDAQNGIQRIANAFEIGASAPESRPLVYFTIS
jgi:thymidine phosphorylase